MTGSLLPERINGLRGALKTAMLNPARPVNNRQRMARNLFVRSKAVSQGPRRLSTITNRDYQRRG